MNVPQDVQTELNQSMLLLTNPWKKEVKEQFENYLDENLDDYVNDKLAVFDEKSPHNKVSWKC